MTLNVVIRVRLLPLYALGWERKTEPSATSKMEGLGE